MFGRKLLWLMNLILKALMHLMNEHEFVERSWKQFNILLLIKSLQWTLFWG